MPFELREEILDISHKLYRVTVLYEEGNTCWHSLALSYMDLRSDENKNLIEKHAITFKTGKEEAKS